MPWEALPARDVGQGDGAFWPLSLPDSAGMLHVLMPSFLEGADGFYEAGLFGGTQLEPQIAHIQRARFSQFSRYLSFDFPPELPNPMLAIRLLDLEGESISIAPQINVSSCGESMAFYDNRLETLEADVSAELAQRLVVVDAVPQPNDYEDGQQFTYSVTGETITLSGNRWLGEPQEESFSAIATGLNGLESGQSATLDPVLFYDFDGGPNQLIEKLILSNAGDQTKLFDMHVPGFDPDVFASKTLNPKSAVELVMNKKSEEFTSPDIHIAAANGATRASVRIVYRNMYQYVQPEAQGQGDQGQGEGQVPAA